MDTLKDVVIPADVLTLVKECKNAYSNGDLKLAWEKWCAIYDRLEDTKYTAVLFKTMRLFSDDEVFDITDYGKSISEL